MNKELKKLNLKDYMLLVLPAITGVLIYAILLPYIYNLMYFFVKDNLEYDIQVPQIYLSIYEKRTRENPIVSMLLDVKPYKAPKQQENLAGTDNTKSPAPTYDISFIYIGKHRYVIIDNKLWSEGDTLPYGEKILRITKDGILVTGKWGERWIKFLK